LRSTDRACKEKNVVLKDSISMRAGDA